MPGPRNYNLKDDILYKGEGGIIRALSDRRMRFKELKSKTGLDSTTLSAYIRHLCRNGIISPDRETKEYYLHRAVQPLAPETYPKAWRAMETIIGDIEFYAKFIAALDKPSRRRSATAEFLRIHYNLLMGSLIMIARQTCSYADPELAGEFFKRSLDNWIVPWAVILSIECFRNKAESKSALNQVAGEFLKVAQSTYQDFLQRLPIGPSEQKRG